MGICVATADRSDTQPARHVVPGSLAGHLPQTLLLPRRRSRRRQVVYRAGQAARSVFLVHAGVYKTTLLSDDGRERVTGFHLKGDVMGVEALGEAAYRCDATALDTGELIEVPRSLVFDPSAGLLEHVTRALADTVRRDWYWMLTLATLDAEQRVASFLLDLSTRQQSLGYSPHRLLLRMTRADIGNFLGLALESVTRVLSRLDDARILRVACRDVEIVDLSALRRLARPAEP